MGINHHINPLGDIGQQRLTEDLVIESIKFAGINTHYIPRDYSEDNTDELFGEDHLASFSKHYPIEMYLESLEGFEGEGDLLRKFGVMINDQASFIVSKRRFLNETNLTKPSEGDLIYFPLTNTLFQIKFVETEEPFYQFGKLYTYKLQAELFQYSNEQFNTGIPQVDKLGKTKGYTIEFVISNPSADFIVDETVTSGSASGKVRSWNTDTDTMYVYNIVGDFISGATITGQQSGATGAISMEDELSMIEDLFSDNREIEDEADDFLDWTEDTPFGRL